MKIRHASSVKTPSLELADGEGTKAVLKQIMRLIYNSFVDIYQDLVNLSVTTVATLPTANKDLSGKSYLKTNAGADDTLHICIYDGAASGYKWQQVTLT